MKIKKLKIKKNINLVDMIIMKNNSKTKQYNYESNQKIY